jgi:hypothetical protein
MLLANGEPPKPFTINLYRAALNKLSKRGFTTRDDLLSKQDDVIKAIDSEFPTNQKKRAALSAVFRVLGDVPNERRVKYYNFFQKCKDTTE